MSARENVYVSLITHAPSLPSPNATVAAITAEIRLFYPPTQEDEALVQLSKAFLQARDQLLTKRAERLVAEAARRERRRDDGERDEARQ